MRYFLLFAVMFALQNCMSAGHSYDGASNSALTDYNPRRHNPEYRRPPPQPRPNPYYPPRHYYHPYYGYYSPYYYNPRYPVYNPNADNPSYPYSYVPAPPRPPDGFNRPLFSR